VRVFDASFYKWRNHIFVEEVHCPVAAAKSTKVVTHAIFFAKMKTQQNAQIIFRRSLHAASLMKLAKNALICRVAKGDFVNCRRSIAAKKIALFDKIYEKPIKFDRIPTLKVFCLYLAPRFKLLCV
jgi:hypothetical protein